MQYLESRPDLFEDLVKVIKLTKWEDILTNEDVTFFAPTDFTITKSVDRMNKYLYNYEGMDKICLLYTSITLTDFLGILHFHWLITKMN